jgi:hypothetical protein
MRLLRMLGPLALCFSAIMLKAANPQTDLDLPDGYVAGPVVGEAVQTLFIDPGIRVVINVPAPLRPDRPTLLVIFALPNGNTIEQTMGCATAPGLDWHFDIQHVAAQIRRYREADLGRNIVVAYAEAETLSWPAWRKDRPDAPGRVAAIVDRIIQAVPGKPPAVALTCHSGGGAFLFSFIDAAAEIPANIERIVFLDANYSYDDARLHGQKLLQWARGGANRRLIVIAYDDRDVTLNGKKIVSDTGGTWRASARMLDYLKSSGLTPTTTDTGPLATKVSLEGKLQFLLHANPENKILHTRLVELNGLLKGLCAGTLRETKWGGTFFGARAYDPLVQPLPSIPDRRPTLPGGKALGEKWTNLTIDQREAAVVAEIARGNFPSFLRHSITLKTKADIAGKPVECEFDVSPDYLAVGADDDFLRIPLTPTAAVKITALLGKSLPTRKMVDAIDAAATIRLEPKPLTEAREALATFARHQALIEDQRVDKPPGELITGIKKDVVLSNRLAEKPARVAIYGWRKLDGQPIQPLTIVHQDSYVDYSHGIRLIGRIVRIDGKARLIENVLTDKELSLLLSDEGPLLAPQAFYQATVKQP